MNDSSLLQQIAESAFTSVGFFWKAAWAFAMGYAISAMIQAFVPKARLTRRMGGADAQSVALATVFGAASSSCSFAALAAARSLVAKGAHFVAAIAFMFASTNLVVELGVLIVVFLGWPYLGAELAGGLVLIAISTTLVRLTAPSDLLDAARERAEEEADPEDDDFSPLERIRSADGWRRVGRAFVGEWQMVWREILVGFTVAGVMKVFVPASFWRMLFLVDQTDLPSWLVALENALVGPLVAAATFIGSMGNIPLAAVLASGGVTFAGLLAFIYADLMVPPLVKVNARYYGMPPALYIAGVMYVSIVLTSLVMNGVFSLFGWIPEQARDQATEATFQVDYTFWLNLAFALVTVGLVLLAHRGSSDADDREGGGHDHDHDHGDGDDSRGPSLQALVTGACILFLVVGLVLKLVA